MEQNADDRRLARRVFVTIGIVLLAMALAFLLWRMGYVLLLGFAGILLAVALDGLAMLVAQYTRLDRGWSLLVVIVTLIVVVGAIVGLLGPYFVDQMYQLAQRLPEAVDNLRSKLQSYPWGRRVLHNVPEPQQLMGSFSSVVTRITGVFSTVLGALANLFVMLVIGIYMAFDPDLYTKAVIYLVPPAKRERVYEVLAALGQALRRWFAGRVASMAVVGMLTYIGLSIIGVQLSLALSVLTAIFEFVPYLGPILALIPALLVAMLQSPYLAVYVLGVYAAVQTAESYLITPLIEKRAVSIPPAYLIFVQVLGGVLAGVIGVILSEPLVVVIAIMVQMLYIADTLGDSVAIMGEKTPGGSASKQSAG
jgi:predicted PurR-regulated permease PerM